jgi:hypothetical protein
MAALSPSDSQALRRLLIHAARQLASCQGVDGGGLRVEITLEGDPPLHVYVDSPAPLPADQAPQLADPADLALLDFLTRSFLAPEEQQVVDELAGAPLKGQELANRLKVGIGSLRHVLAGLVNRGVLKNTSSEGYSVANAHMMTILQARKCNTNATSDP